MTLNNGPKNTKNEKGKTDRIIQSFIEQNKSKDINQKITHSSQKITKLFSTLIGSEKKEEITKTPDSALAFVTKLIKKITENKIYFALNIDILEIIISSLPILKTSENVLTIINMFQMNQIKMERSFSNADVMPKLILLCGDINNSKKLKEFLEQLRTNFEVFSKSRVTIFLLAEIISDASKSKDIQKIKTSLKMCEEIISSDTDLENKVKSVLSYQIELFLANVLIKNILEVERLKNEIITKGGELLTNTELLMRFLSYFYFASTYIQEKPEMKENFEKIKMIIAPNMPKSDSFWKRVETLSKQIQAPEQEKDGSNETRIKTSSALGNIATTVPVDRTAYKAAGGGANHKRGFLKR